MIRDVAVLISRSTRIVGTPEQIADALEEWQAAGVDGINVINWVIPGSFVEFAEKVLPVLRDRGLAQRDYGTGETLRERLFGSPRLNDRHPAAKYRGAFAEPAADVATEASSNAADVAAEASPHPQAARSA